jgi:hypothetical protein
LKVKKENLNFNCDSTPGKGKCVSKVGKLWKRVERNEEAPVPGEHWAIRGKGLGVHSLDQCPPQCGAHSQTNIVFMISIAIYSTVRFPSSHNKRHIAFYFVEMVIVIWIA